MKPFLDRLQPSVTDWMEKLESFDHSLLLLVIIWTCWEIKQKYGIPQALFFNIVEWPLGDRALPRPTFSDLINSYTPSK